MQLVPEKIRKPLSNFNFSLFEKESLRTFFLAFRLKCYFLLILSPFGLGAAAYLAQAAIGSGSFGNSLGLFSLSLLVLLPWTLVPITFLFTIFQPNTWQRKISWAYVGLLLVSYTYWLVIF